MLDPYKYDYLDEEGGVFYANIPYPKFQKFELLLTDQEIESGLQSIYPGSSAEVSDSQVKRIRLDLSNMDFVEFASKGWEFKELITTLLIDFIAQKYAGDRKLDTTLVQQEALISLGVITTNDAQKLKPEALECLLGRDLGL